MPFRIFFEMRFRGHLTRFRRTAELQGKVKRQETGVMGLLGLCGEGCVILTSTVFN